MDNSLKVEMLRVIFYEDRDCNVARISVEDREISALFVVQVPRKIESLTDIRTFALAKARELAARVATAS